MTNKSEIGYFQTQEWRMEQISNSEDPLEIDGETHELYLAILREPDFFSNDRLYEMLEAAFAATSRFNSLIIEGKAQPEQIQGMYSKHTGVYIQTLLQLANLNNKDLV